VFFMLARAWRELPVLFVGWEGVGLCSYLLIGFWFNDKAMQMRVEGIIVNRTETLVSRRDVHAVREHRRSRLHSG